MWELIRVWKFDVLHTILNRDQQIIVCHWQPPLVNLEMQMNLLTDSFCCQPNLWHFELGLIKYLCRILLLCYNNNGFRCGRIRIDSNKLKRVSIHSIRNNKRCKSNWWRIQWFRKFCDDMISILSRCFNESWTRSILFCKLHENTRCKVCRSVKYVSCSMAHHTHHLLIVHQIPILIDVLQRSGNSQKEYDGENNLRSCLSV